MLQQSDPIRTAFRRLPWWLRLVLAHLALVIVLGLPIAGVVLVIRSAISQGARRYIALGCALGLLSLPFCAFLGPQLLDEVRYAFSDPDRPAVRKRERQAIERLLRDYRENPPD